MKSQMIVPRCCCTPIPDVENPCDPVYFSCCLYRSLFIELEDGLSVEYVSGEVLDTQTIKHTVKIICDADAESLEIELLLPCVEEMCLSQDRTGEFVGECEIGIISYGNNDTCPGEEFKLPNTLIAPRCVYLTPSGDWGWADMPFLLWEVVGDINDPDILRYKGGWMVTAVRNVPQQEGLDTWDKHWYPGHSFQFEMAFEYDVREKRFRADADLRSSGDFITYGRDFHTENNPNGRGRLSYRVGNSTWSSPTDVFCLGGEFTFSEENINSQHAGLLAGMTIYIPEQDEESFIEATEFTEKCFQNEMCLMDNSFLLNIKDFDEPLTSIGSNWWYWNNRGGSGDVGAMWALTGDREWEVYNSGTIGYRGFFDNVVTSYEGPYGEYFYGAGQIQEYVVAAEPIVIFRDEIGKQPMVKPFIFDPYSTYTFRWKIHSETEIFDDSTSDLWEWAVGQPTGGDAIIQGPFLTIGNDWITYSLSVIIPANNEQDKRHFYGNWDHMMVPETPPSIFPSIPAGAVEMQLEVTPDPDDCERTRFRSTGPGGTREWFRDRVTACELKYISIQGLGWRDKDDPRYNNMTSDIHCGFFDMTVDVTSADLIADRRPNYSLCVFSMFYYMAADFQDLEVGVEVTIIPVVKEMREPLEVNVLCGNLPPGLSLDESTGIISGEPEETGNGFVSFYVWDKEDTSEGGGSEYVQTPEYMWQVGSGMQLIYPPVGMEDGFYWTFDDNSEVTLDPEPSGGTPPYLNYRIETGALPDSFTLDAASGVITRPAATAYPPEEGVVSISMDDQEGESATTNDYTWQVVFILPLTIDYPAYGGSKDIWDFQQTAPAGGDSIFPDVEGGSPPYVAYRIVAGALPNRFTLGTTTGEVSRPQGAVSQVGTGTVTIEVEDSAGVTAETIEEWEIFADVTPFSIRYPSYTSPGLIPSKDLWTLNTIQDGEQINVIIEGGVAPFTFEVIGLIPSWFQLTDNGNFSEDIGIGLAVPTPEQVFTVRATDSEGNTAEAVVTWSSYNASGPGPV